MCDIGSLNDGSGEALIEVGLDYLQPQFRHLRRIFTNSNITTRTYQNRLDTLQEYETSGIKPFAVVALWGMGEEQKDRVGLLRQLFL